MKINRTVYWLSTVAIFVLMAIIAGYTSQSEGPGIVFFPVAGVFSDLWLPAATFSVLYLPIAALRLRDMGKPMTTGKSLMLIPIWLVMAVLPLANLLFIIWLGVARPRPTLPPLRGNTTSTENNRKILIGAGAVLLVVAVIVGLVFVLRDDSPDQGNLAKCDEWLRQQLLASPGTTANAANTNLVVAHVQSQRPNTCPTSTWNPLIANVAEDHLGNIDVHFSTSGTVHGSAATMPAEGTPRWVYSAAEGQWYSSAPNDPPILVEKPTFAPTRPSSPAAKQPTRTPWSLPTVAVPPTVPAFPTPTAGIIRPMEAIPTVPPWTPTPRPTVDDHQGSPTRAADPFPTPVQWTQPTNEYFRTIVRPVLRTDHSYGFPANVIVGQLQNVTGYRMSYVQVDCQVYTGDVQVASGLDITNGLPPGAKWEYSAELFEEVRGSNHTVECFAQGW